MTTQQFQEEIKAVFALGAADRLSEAAGRLGRLLQVAPAQPAVLNEVGMFAFRLGLLPEGVAWLGRSLIVNPAQATIWAVRGVGLKQLQRPVEGLEDLNRAIALQPSYADAHFDRGCILRDLRRFADALADFDRAIGLDPGNAAAHANRGALLHEMSREQEALASAQRAVAIAPEYVLGHYNLGVILSAMGRQDEALRSYDRAIAVDPRHPRAAPAYANRGLLLNGSGRRDEALQSIERSLVLDRGCAQAHYAMAVILQEDGRLDEALQHYDRAVAADPGYVEANWNRALLQLRQGNFEEGWRGYDWRWRGVQRADSGLRDSPLMWLGDKPLAERTILLMAEQGLGDTLQFCRYATLVAEKGARVLLQVQKPLQTIVRSLPGVAEVFAMEDPIPDFDYLCPLLSLPLAFKTTLASIPGRTPYLRADEDKLRAWQGRLARKNKLRVGLVWSGGFRPEQPETWAVNARRNVPLSLMRPLRHSAIEFYSLQKGEPAESEWAELRAKSWDGPELIDWTSDLHDFSDTAALVGNLDLVISADTSTAHLAGALGKPVWILNRFDSCWRWLLDRCDSPWYPTARLFRQSRPGDWESVIEKVREELLRLVR